MRITVPPLVRRLLAVAVVPLLMACSANPAASSPTASSTASASPGASPTPTATASASLTAAPMAHPTGPTDVVLRVEERGGLVAPVVAAIGLPAFTLYGDGRAIYRAGPSGPASPSPSGAAVALPPLRVANLTEPQVQALLIEALDVDHLRVARATYDLGGVADAGTTIFTVDADGVRKIVSVYALGMTGGQIPPQDVADRVALAALRDRLADFGAQVAAGAASDAGTYTPTAYRGVLQPGTGNGEQRSWPWTDLTPSAFKATDETGLRTAVVSAAQADLLVREPQGGAGPVAVEGPDRAPYLLWLRPLLPDETR